MERSTLEVDDKSEACSLLGGVSEIAGESERDVCVYVTSLFLE